MNQILSTENRENKANRLKGGPKDIKSILKFFAVMLIVFGIFLVTSSSLAMFSGKETKTAVKSGNKPTIEVEVKGDDQLIFKIMHDVAIDRVEYSWNDEALEVMNGGQRKYIEKMIDIPVGESSFVLRAIDVNGEKAEYTNTYSVKSSAKIETEQSGSNVKITVNSKNEIKSVEYAWDDEEYTELEVEEGKTNQEFEIEVESGNHKLTVIVTDENDKTTKEEVDIIGKKEKPTVKISMGKESYVITAYDEEGLEKVEITTLSDGKVITMNPDGKEFKYEFPLKEGDDNKIQVVAYNEAGVASEPAKAKLKNKWTK